MPIILDHQLQEQIPHDSSTFPITFYCDELADLPNHAGPMHWHPYFEIATAQSSVLDFQVGQTHTILEPGDSIFVNQNMLHGIRQLSGLEPDPCQTSFFPAQWLPLRPAPFTGNTSGRFWLVTLFPLLCSGTTTTCGMRSASGFAPRISPCRNSPIVTK